MQKCIFSLFLQIYEYNVMVLYFYFIEMELRFCLKKSLFILNNKI